MVNFELFVASFNEKFKVPYTGGMNFELSYNIPPPIPPPVPVMGVVGCTIDRCVAFVLSLKHPLTPNHISRVKNRDPEHSMVKFY